MGTSFFSLFSRETTVIVCLLWWIWWNHEKRSQGIHQNRRNTFVACTGNKTLSRFNLQTTREQEFVMSSQWLFTFPNYSFFTNGLRPEHQQPKYTEMIQCVGDVFFYFTMDFLSWSNDYPLTGWWTANTNLRILITHAYNYSECDLTWSVLSWLMKWSKFFDGNSIW